MFWYTIIVELLVITASYVGCGLAVRIFRERMILDKPNKRSSHSKPTPVGGGLVVCGIIGIAGLLTWFMTTVATNISNLQVPVIILLMFFLLFISWKDDLNNLSVKLRLFAHLFAVLVGLFALSHRGYIFQGLFPYGIDIIVTIILWLWMINLTNFMDGIDGITGTEGICICIGVCLVLLFSPNLTTNSEEPLLPYVFTLSAVIAGALGGFLIWNWQPARLFLGDAGSIPLGYLLGWMLLELAGKGLWQAALLLPLYYLMDATLTLLRRLWRQEHIFRAHRSHFYQRATFQNLSHRYAVLIILVLNTALIALGIWSLINPNNPLLVIGIGLFLTAIILWYFESAYSKK